MITYSYAKVHFGAHCISDAHQVSEPCSYCVTVCSCVVQVQSFRAAALAGSHDDL